MSINRSFVLVITLFSLLISTNIFAAEEEAAVAPTEDQAQDNPVEAVVEGVGGAVKDIITLPIKIIEAVVGKKSHTINAQARGFVADIVYIQPGDRVGWINMTSHNTVSIDGMIPEGAEPWRSKLGENLKLTLEIEGVYAYVCEPHLGFGMVGLSIVGETTNVEEVRDVALKLEGAYRRILGKLKKVQDPKKE